MNAPVPISAVLREHRFEAAWTLGYHGLVPVIPPGAALSPKSSISPQFIGKIPGRRWLNGSWSGFDWIPHQTIEADLPRWRAMGAGVGLKTGDNGDGASILAIDADTLNPELADLIERRVVAAFGRLPKRVGRAPKALYPVRVANTFAYRRVEFDDGGEKPARVEVLSDRRFFVVEGVHPETLRPYLWERPLPPLADLPFVEAAALLAFLDLLARELPAAKPVLGGELVATVDQATLIAPLELVEQAVAILPNTSEHFPAREDYLGVGYMIRAATAPNEAAGKALFHEWCARWQDPDGRENDPDTVDKDWARMKPPFRRGAGSLFRTADRLTGGRFTAERFHEAVPERVAPLFPDAAAAPRARKLKTLGAFLQGYVPLEYAVEPLMRTGSLYSLTARTGAGKTAFLISVSYAVITGRSEIIGLDVQQGRVAYLTFENPDDVRMRMMVTAHRLRIDTGAVSDRLLIIDTRDKPEAILAELAEAAAVEPLRLVIVDTFAAFFDGDNVNDPVQGGEFMRRLRPMTRLPGLPAVVVASHPVKNAGEDQLVPYGSGAILNEVDGNLTLWRRSETGTVKLHWQGKLRGLEFEPREFRFEISGSPDVLDAKSRLVKLPTLLPAEAIDAEAQEASERTAGVAIMQAMEAEPTATQRRWAELAGCSQTLVHRHLSKLAKEKLVEKALGHWNVTAKGRKELERWA